jgi:hypothetical protein
MVPALDKLAARQLSLVTYDQLLTIGLTPRQVQRMVATGALIRVRIGVYRVAGAPFGWNEAVLAAALAAGHDAVVSHGTAAALWSLRHCEHHPAGIHVSSARQVRLKGVIGHQVQLTADEQTVRGRIPITTAERTIVDWGPTLSFERLGQCVDDATRRRLIGLEHLRRAVAHLPVKGGGRRLGPLRQVLAERSRGYRPDDSDFETEMNRLWDELGLPPARKQYRVTVDGHNFRLDRAIVECRIGIEWDSYRYHSAPSDRDHDSNRRARLAAAGWIIIPVTGHAQPELIARAVLRAYQDRGGSIRVTDEEAGAAV